MDWSLDSLTNWLKDAFTGMINDIIEFFSDLMLDFIETCLDLVVYLFQQIPTPSFIEDYQLRDFVEQLPDEVLWFVGILRLDEALGFLTAALTFRLIRKIVTLGIW